MSNLLNILTAIVTATFLLTIQTLAADTLEGTLTLTARDDFPSTVEAWDFTYSELGNPTELSGLLLKPLGNGPFPAVIANHGKGGSAESFALEKGPDWFAPSGYMVIAPELTHSGSIFCADQTNECGGHPENIWRSTTALNILSSQQLFDLLGPIVDTEHYFIYGNSLGALTTLEMIEIPEIRSQIISAAVSAGGVIRRRDSPLMYMTPNGLSGILDIETPLLQLHGRLDDVIYAREAQLVADRLDSIGAEHQMVWYPDHGHNIARGQLTTDSVKDFILEWFDNYLIGGSPQITELSLTAAQPNTQITITGVNFGDNLSAISTLTLNGNRINTTFWSDTSIQFTVPNKATSGEFIITKPIGPVDDEWIEPIQGGTLSNPMPFTVLPLN